MLYMRYKRSTWNSVSPVCTSSHTGDDKLGYLLGYLLCPLLPCVRGHLLARTGLRFCFFRGYYSTGSLKRLR